MTPRDLVFERDIDTLGRAMDQGAATAAGLVEAYLERIARFDPALHAIARVNPDARADAERLDGERAAGRHRGPLHGVPVVVKDNYETLGMETTAGSALLAGFAPPRDAHAVARLREAGAVILAKTTMHEFAYGILTVGSGFGTAHNPYDRGRNPGGSSGGTGASVAASFAAAGMGSDTCGSIRIPAAHNHLVGIRGTQGLSSRRGIVPLSSTQDIGGPLGRSVRDVAHLLDATAGPDPADAQTRGVAAHLPASYAATLDPGALRGARVGLLQNLLEIEPADAPVAAVIRHAARALAECGATVVEVEIPGLRPLLEEPEGGWVVLASDFHHDLDAYLAANHAPVSSLREIVESGATHPEIADALARSLASDIDSEIYRVARARRGAVRAAVEEAMDGARVEALAYPSIRRVAAPIGEAQEGTNCRLAANSGLPAVSLPAGFAPEGLPVGLELLGRPWSETALLGLAYAFETAGPARRPPPLEPV